MSIWEEHRDEYHLEQAIEEAEHKLHANINASFTKVLAQAILKMKHKNK
jgi:hypothetical protein